MNIPHALTLPASLLAGAHRSDSPQERLEKGFLVGLTLLNAAAGLTWGVLYWALGDPIASAIPGGYGILTIASLWVFGRVGGYSWLRKSQLVLCLLLPTLLLIRLGGFAASGGVSLWAITSPLASLILGGQREAARYFLWFLILIPVGPLLALDEPPISEAWSDLFFVLNTLGVSTVIAFVLSGFSGEREQALIGLGRRYTSVRRAFSLYVSPNLVDHLLASPQHVELGEGERRECSFVMTDIAGFTSLVERTSPDRVIRVLNDYLAGMTQIALAHGGTIDRIVGDAVAVVFSAPVVQADHARRAIECATEMDRFASAFAKARRDEGVPLGETRIGVNSGTVIVGNVGSDAYLDYRALGDAINTAARLESANRELGTRVCIGEETAAQCPELELRPVGELKLRGKSEPVRAYTLA
ncbi:MAG: adenylate/guanylate cyclase domain-containing protein [Gemmatimonadota bacterium]